MRANHIHMVTETTCKATTTNEARIHLLCDQRPQVTSPHSVPHLRNQGENMFHYAFAFVLAYLFFTSRDFWGGGGTSG